jgi:hypothetical protein
MYFHKGSFDDVLFDESQFADSFVSDRKTGVEVLVGTRSRVKIWSSQGINRQAGSYFKSCTHPIESQQSNENHILLISVWHGLFG